MSEEEKQLVEVIAREVIAALGRRGAADAAAPTAAAASAAPGRADVRPPIGVCTGDYSKFPELAGRLYGGNAGDAAADRPAEAPTAATSAAPPVPEPMPLTGIVTAAQLRAAMDEATGGVAVIASDARLSPLAHDLAKQLPARVRRQEAGHAGQAPAAGASAGPLPWLWWIDGMCPMVQELVASRRDRLRGAAGAGGEAALGRVVRELAAGVKARRLAGGLLFVRSAARAACFANRCASLRAVVGTCGEAVEQGVRELGANVLIVEYPHHGLRSASAMVDRMLQESPKAPSAVERDLAEMQRCG